MNHGVIRIDRADVERAYIKRINYELTAQEEEGYLDDSLLLAAQEKAEYVASCKRVPRYLSAYQKAMGE